MRKIIIVRIIALVIAVCALTACTNTENTEKLGPALFKGQSEHWKVQVKYQPADKDMEEMASVEPMTPDTIVEAAVTIVHSNQDSMTYHVVEPLMLHPGQPIILGEKGKVKSWKDTEQVIVEWKVGGTQFKEYITPAKVEDTAVPK